MSLIVKVGKAGKRVVKKFLPEEKHHVSYTRRIERVKTRERVVAMTFDDGPMDLPSSPDKFDGKALTDILLDTLGEYGAQADWGGVRYDHYPDINQDERGGAVHNQRLLRRMLDEGHQVTNHGYRHVLFGKKPFVYGKRDHFHGLDQVVSDLTRLHTLLKETYGYEMTMARPPHYVDKIEGGFTSYDAYDQMGYLYLAAAFDGAGWLPLHHGSAQESLRAEVEAMVDPMRKVLEADPDGLAGQIIFQKDGYNMCRRTPVAFGLKKQLELLKKYGYQVVTVQRLMEYSPFADVGREDPGDCLLRQPAAPGRPHDLGGTGDAAGPPGGGHWPPDSENPGDRHSPARQLGRHGLVRRAGDSEVRHGPGWGGEQPAQRIFCPGQGLYPPAGLRGLSGVSRRAGAETERRNVTGGIAMEFIKLSLEEELAVVTIDRPKSLNALNSQVYREIIATLRQVEAMDQVKKAFAAGADIAQMVHEDAVAGRRLSGLCHEAANLLESMRQVTIAAVNGFALGGGCELTLACDLRIAADHARFALPEVTLGIIPGGGGTQRLARIIGVGRAKELIFTGDQIDAQEAYRLGLANHVVPRDELMETCRALGKKIASRASYAVFLAKTAINSSQEIDLKNGAEREKGRKKVAQFGTP